MTQRHDEKKKGHIELSGKLVLLFDGLPADISICQNR